MDFSFLSEYGSFFITGAKYTLILSMVGVFFGIIVGGILAFMKISKNLIAKAISTVYIEFIRGTPLLVQLYIIYFAFDFESVTAGIIALSINSAAYVAEIIRSGIAGIDKGQMEAARSLGMGHWSSMRYIIIPQGFRNILPVLVNEFIAIIKESSIISVIGVAELMYSTNNIMSATYTEVGPLTVVALIYFVITFTISKLMVRLERRLNVDDKNK